MSQIRLLPTPSALDSGPTQITGGSDFSSLPHLNVDLFTPVPSLRYPSNVSNSMSNADVRSAQQSAMPYEHVVRKRRRLDFVKCDDCRKDKQKCLPVEREPGQKCNRCVDKELPCSEGKRASRKSRRTETIVTQPKPETSNVLFSSGLDLQDWVFLVSYRAIMARALDCLQTLRAQTMEHFRLPGSAILILNELEVNYFRFEAFVASLDRIVFNNARELVKFSQHKDVSVMLSAFTAQLVPAKPVVPCTPEFRETAGIEDELNLHDRIGGDDSASQYLIYAHQIEIIRAYSRSWSLPQTNGRLNETRIGLNETIRKISVKIHAQAREVLLKLGLWEALPTTMKRCATFLPYELATRLPTKLSILELNGEAMDCLGRGALLRQLDSMGANQLLFMLKFHLESDWDRGITDEERTGIACSINQKDLLGRSALHAACQHGRTQVVKDLLALGASPRSATANGASPLHYAAAGGSSAICQLLLSLEDRYVENDHLGHSPLYYAVRNEHYETVEVLVRGDTNLLNVAEIYEVASRGSERIFRYLLKTEPKPALPWTRRILEQAIRDKNISIIKAIGDEASAIIDEKNDIGQTPLFFAAGIGFDLGVLYLSRRSDVDVNARNTDNRTPLMIAALNGYREVVKILIEIPQIDLLSSDDWTEAAVGKDIDVEIVFMLGNEILQRARNKHARERPQVIQNQGLPLRV